MRDTRFNTFLVIHVLASCIWRASAVGHTPPGWSPYDDKVGDPVGGSGITNVAAGCFVCMRHAPTPSRLPEGRNSLRRGTAQDGLG
eukprot:s38_g4.t1